MTWLLSRVVLGAGVAAVMTLGSSAITDAQPHPGSESPRSSDEQKRATAKKLVAEAITAQKAQNYDKAIELYQKAYVLIPHPDLLFNIGQAHRLAGRLEQAATFYNRYLVADPSGSESATARAFLSELKTVGIVPKPDDVKEPPPTSPPAPSPMIAPEASPNPDPPSREDTVVRPGRALQIMGLVLVGAGLVSTAIGGYYTLKWKDTQTAVDLEVAIFEMMNGPITNDFSDYLHQKYGYGYDEQRRQDIAYVVAGGLVIGGAVTYYLGYRKNRAVPKTALAPVFGRNFAGVALGGSLP